MIKELLAFTLVLVLFLSPVFALEVEIKDHYLKGETAIIKISGDFIDPVGTYDAKIYSGGDYFSFGKDLDKIGDDYYFYFLASKEGNYTFMIKDAHYYERGGRKRENLLYNFSIIENQSSFSVEPGFIKTSKDRFSLRLEGFKDININSSFGNKTKNIELGEGDEESIEFSTNDFYGHTITNVGLSSSGQEYLVPVAIYREGKQNKDDNFESLSFIKERANFSLIEGERGEFSLELFNGGDKVLNVTLNSTISSLNISADKIRLEPGNEEIDFEVFAREVGERYGEITATSDNLSDSVSIRLTVLEEGIEINESEDYNESGGESTGTCSDYDGKICKSNQECEGEYEPTIEGLCCVGECVSEGSETNWGNIIWAIVILLVLGLVGFFIYKRVHSEKSEPDRKLKQESKKYEGRFKDKTRPKEVRDKLSRN